MNTVGCGGRLYTTYHQLISIGKGAYCSMHTTPIYEAPGGVELITEG